MRLLQLLKFRSTWHPHSSFLVIFAMLFLLSACTVDEEDKLATNPVDVTIPAITLLGANPLTLELGTVYSELGATATDNIDGDISNSLVIDASAVDMNTVGSYTVTYNVKDLSNNNALQVTRTVTITTDATNTSDVTIPVITLLGANPLTLELGTAYSEPGATAADNIDGDISASLVIDASAVDVNTVGSYSVTYNVKDLSNNNAVQVTRAVTISPIPPTAVVPRNNPAIITGVDSGSITEDDATQLESTGKLEITDIDTGESLFVASDISNSYGSFSLAENGNWRFTANNDLTEIQSLASGQVAPLEITVNSFDRTVHFITINFSGVDDAAVFTGIDSGDVTEDADPEGNNLLEANGKLDITDIDTDEASFVSEEIIGTYGSLMILADGSWDYSADNTQQAIQNLSAAETITDTLTVRSAGGSTHDIVITINGVDDTTVISGDDTKTITEDDDPDGNNLLEASGVLNITDSDSADTSFTPANITGLYGAFTLDADGNWTYAADNTQADVASLANDLVLTEILTISSINGTLHDVVITINSSDISLTWTAPDTREDGSTISLSEIAGYRIYYGNAPGNYHSSIDIKDGSAVEKTIKKLKPGDYFFVLTTYDTENRESLYSAEILLNNSLNTP